MNNISFDISETDISDNGSTHDDYTIEITKLLYDE